MALIRPKRNDIFLYMRMLYLRTEKSVVNELKRQQANGLVDYGTYAALMRVQQTLQEMQDESFTYVPEMVNKVFRDANARAGYEAAEALSVAQTAIVEQLTGNLLGCITEAAETAYKTSESVLQLGRLHPDVFRNPVILSSAIAEAEGRGMSPAVTRALHSLQNDNITSFVDKSGREWGLTEYCTMATRTVRTQATVAANLTSDDWDLWKITPNGSTCALCAAYEGRVYSKSGTNPDYPPLSAAFGKIDPAGGNDLSNTYLNIHPNCLVPGGFVLGEGIVAESRRLYSGKVIILKTSRGNEIAVTPNHPILTDRGFIAAELLNEGDKIIEATGEYSRFIGQAPNNIDVPTVIDEKFHAAMKSCGGSSHTVKGSAVQFHGDGIPDSEVDIIFADSFGNGVRNAVGIKEATEKDFPPRKRRRVLFFAKRTAAKVIIRTGRALNGFVSGFGFVLRIKGIPVNGKQFPNHGRGTSASGGDLPKGHPLIMKVKKTLKLFSVFPFVLFGNIVKAFSPVAENKVNSEPLFNTGKDANTESEFSCDFGTAEPVLVARLKELLGNNGLVVSSLSHKKTSYYAGYVYNLETKYGYYVYNNIVTHNCLHSLVRYTTAGRTDEEIQKDKDFSSFEKRPADVDYRTKKQIEEYREKERKRAEFLATRRQWNDYRERLGKEIPSLETFEKHKKAGDDKYKAWEKAYRKKGAELRKEIKAQEMIPNPAPPAVQYKPFESGESANAYFGERPPRSLRRENREEYDRLREEYSRSTYGTWEAGLTGDESLSIANYSGDAYSGINGLLRKQMTEKMVDAWDATERMGIKDMIGNIDSALEKFELKDPIRVFRTCERDVLDALRPEVGATFRDNGYVSTSALSKKVASGNVVMQIDVPPGRNHGAWINPLSGAADEEYEYLLPRGSEFRITGVEQKGGDTVIKMEFIGSKKQPIDYATKEEVIDRWKRLGIYDENNASKI